MTQAPPADDSNNRVVVVTLDEESIGRSGPDIEHERAIAIYDLVEQNLFAPEGAAAGPFTLHIAIKLPLIRSALTSPIDSMEPVAPISRRTLVRSALLAAGVAVSLIAAV